MLTCLFAREAIACMYQFNVSTSQFLYQIRLPMTSACISALTVWCALQLRALHILLGRYLHLMADDVVRARILESQMNQ